MRVWRGLDSLQAQFLRETLLANGIDCYLDRDTRHLDLGMNDLGLWVAAPDKARARQLIAACEAEMRTALDSGSASESEE
ncbi:MAG: hypothetical protein HY653_03745 [Acidobacteria bacterium]|nr:hypothetical protein [Acidobacteriota bacterium]